MSKDAEVLKPCRGKSDNGASGFCRYHFRPHFLQHSGFRLAPASVISVASRQLWSSFCFPLFFNFFLQGILRITSSSKASGAAGSGRTGKKLEFVGLLDCWTCSNPFLYILSFVHTPFLLLRLRNGYPASGIPHMTPRDQVLES